MEQNNLPHSEKKFWNAIQELQNNVSNSAWDLFERKMKIQGMVRFISTMTWLPILAPLASMLACFCLQTKSSTSIQNHSPKQGLPKLD